MSDTHSIRPAESADIPSISSFLSSARYVHRHLDWRSTIDWVGTQPFCLLEDSKRITGLLAYPQDPPGVSWIRCYACAPMTSPSRAWADLFAESLKCQETEKTIICAVGLQEWFSNLLTSHNFSHFQDIVVLIWDRKMPPAHPLSPLFELRPMMEDDIDAVAAVDQKAFEALWVNSPETIRLAYRQSAFTEVAEYRGEIVGYQLSTANQFSAHLARLAVHPDYQRHLVGYNLVLSMFQHYLKQNVLQVTVNTQQNNYSSLTLYQKLGFEITGEHYPILVYNR